MTWTRARMHVRLRDTGLWCTEELPGCRMTRPWPSFFCKLSGACCGDHSSTDRIHVYGLGHELLTSPIKGGLSPQQKVDHDPS